MYCSKCGSKISDGFQYCNKCGAKVYFESFEDSDQSSEKEIGKFNCEGQKEEKNLEDNKNNYIKKGENQEKSNENIDIAPLSNDGKVLSNKLIDKVAINRYIEKVKEIYKKYNKLARYIMVIFAIVLITIIIKSVIRQPQIKTSVSAVNKNISNITSTSSDAISSNKVTSISLDKTTYILIVGETYNFIATITPSDATNTDILWGSSDTNIVSVDNKGEITAIAKGTATITAKTSDGGYTATCNVIVNPKEDSLDSKKVKALNEVKAAAQPGDQITQLDQNLNRDGKEYFVYKRISQDGTEGDMRFCVDVNTLELYVLFSDGTFMNYSQYEKQSKEVIIDTSIDQLNKSLLEYTGKKVRFTGIVAYIKENYGVGDMLLSSGTGLIHVSYFQKTSFNKGSTVTVVGSVVGRTSNYSLDGNPITIPSAIAEIFSNNQSTENTDTHQSNQSSTSQEKLMDTLHKSIVGSWKVEGGYVISITDSTFGGNKYNVIEADSNKLVIEILEKTGKYKYMIEIQDKNSMMEYMYNDATNSYTGGTRLDRVN